VFRGRYPATAIHATIPTALMKGTYDDTTGEEPKPFCTKQAVLGILFYHNDASSMFLREVGLKEHLSYQVRFSILSASAGLAWFTFRP
jgi:hypothetical protein